MSDMSNQTFQASLSGHDIYIHVDFFLHDKLLIKNRDYYQRLIPKY